MKLIVNGEEKEFEKASSISEIIKILEIEDKVMAAAVNMNVVKKENWENFKLKENDSLELLNFVGGG